MDPEQDFSESILLEILKDIPDVVEGEGTLGTVGDYEMIMSITNTVVHGLVLTTSDLDMNTIREMAVKEKNKTLTITSLNPKGSITLSNTDPPSIAVRCGGAEGLWMAVLLVHMFALSQTRSGNPSVPYMLKPVHCGLTIKPLHADNHTIDLNKFMDIFSKYPPFNAQFDLDNMPRASIMVGGDSERTPTCAMYGTAKAVPVGIPLNNIPHFMHLFARLLVYCIENCQP